MDTGVGVAGLLCIAMALGHMAIGLIWVLPGVEEGGLPPTPFGPPAMSAVMVRVTWHMVTLLVLAIGGLLLTLAWAPATDPETAALRWLGTMWLAGATMAAAVARRYPRSLLRLPVPLLWVVVGILCWLAG